MSNPELQIVLDFTDYVVPTTEPDAGRQTILEKIVGKTMRGERFDAHPGETKKTAKTD